MPDDSPKTDKLDKTATMKKGIVRMTLAYMIRPYPLVTTIVTRMNTLPDDKMTKNKLQLKVTKNSEFKDETKVLTMKTLGCKLVTSG